MRPLRTARNAIALLASRRRRARLARFHLLAEVRAWRRRGQLSGDAGRALAREATGVDQAEYLADFGMHLALKPAYKTVAWLAVPILLEVGVIPLEVGAALLIFAGSIARTAYTGWRTASACARGLPGPWLALLIGTAPIVGSAAFPAQLLRDGRSGRRFAAWAVCALITRAGRAIPVWGGPDTLTEHAFNRVGLRVAGRGSGAALAQESSARQVRR